MSRLKIGVIGHVEHVTIGRVEALPRAGDIAHLEDVEVIPGGGGGIAFHQLLRSPAEVHLFTAIGADEAGRHVEAQLAATGAMVHAAHRAGPHTRDVVMIDPGGERTIVVVGQPLHPTHEDALDWSLLAGLDLVYFTAQDPELLRRARRARRLVVTARRRRVLTAAGVEADIVVGSRLDPLETGERATYAVPPRALVLTEGAAGGTVETAEGVARFAAPALDRVTGGAYGAGDSFAGALCFYAAAGVDSLAAAERAAPFGAAVLAAINPLRTQLRIEPMADGS